MTYFFETYGCQMNSAESAALDLVCRERGWTAVSSGEEADLVLLNTCSVRATAETRVLGRLALYESLKKKRSRPFTLVVAGCMAERLGEGLKEKVPAVDYVMGTAARSLFPRILEAAEQGMVSRDAGLLDPEEKPVFAFSPLHLAAAGGQRPYRSFVPIMHGCNNFCSYCIVPYVRGRERSRDPASILEEIRLLEERGVREITLLGQNVNTYRWEGPVPEPAAGTPRAGVSPPVMPGILDFPGLLRLLAAALEGSPIRWVRFLSANPKDFSPETISVMAENPVFCRHLHLCVQHGSDRILEAMNRRYTREQYLGLVDRIRTALPGISLSTDILVGFPGEREEDLEDTLSLMEEVKFLYAYMYHYNPREGTRAYAFPGRIPEPLKRERLGRVIALQKKHTAELLKSRLGSRERVLVEGISRKNADELITRTERDEMAVVPGPASLIGSFAELSLSALRGNTFRAKSLVLPGQGSHTGVTLCLGV
ncbi:MAG: tRNA (N6-isopentenyl adenosine(37)-C2)-methylthiotransferase MiaB [Treponema sp.]|jgi:tRNA-2-methylthio-N6-dimethylallyladenosine synthase|nr:tRNA (N6-isopentenyl adenosine(37)-C2)-methylthiotransferase MiaB [Treponema sp.]